MVAWFQVDQQSDGRIEYSLQRCQCCCWNTCEDSVAVIETQQDKRAETSRAETSRPSCRRTERRRRRCRKHVGVTRET